MAENSGSGPRLVPNRVENDVKVKILCLRFGIIDRFQCSDDKIFRLVINVICINIYITSERILLIFISRNFFPRYKMLDEKRMKEIGRNSLIGVILILRFFRCSILLCVGRLICQRPLPE